jgi:hypothetical protein
MREKKNNCALLYKDSTAAAHGNVNLMSLGSGNAHGKARAKLIGMILRDDGPYLQWVCSAEQPIDHRLARSIWLIPECLLA